MATPFPQVAREEVRQAARYLARKTAAITLAIGVGAAVTAFLVLRALAVETAESGVTARTEQIAKAIEARVALPVQALEAVVAYQRVMPPDRSKYAIFARSLLAKYPSLAALEYAEIVSHADRAAFEARLSHVVGAPTTIREPGPSGAVVTAPERASYTALVQMEPWLPEVIGLDVAFEPGRRASLAATIARGERYCSPRLRLVEDPPEVYSVVIYQPEYEGGVVPPDEAGRRRNIRGFAIALFRLDPLVQHALTGLDRNGLALSILDKTDLSSGLVYPAAPLPPSGDFTSEREITFAGRTWSVRVEATLAPHYGAAWTVLGLGFTLSLVLAVALGALAEARRYRRENAEIRHLGQYEILRLIAAGGMGRVYEARHALLKRRTALKVVSPDHGEDMLLRFEREAQATSLLTHPNTVVVFDYGRSASGHFYYAMEFVEGPSFAELVRFEGKLAPARVRHLLLQVCGALAEAHARGFVHRDVKPQNLMVTTRGGRYDVVKVLDFGLVKDIHARGGQRVTQQGSVSGTPGYLPPEVFSHPDAIGPPLDVYAVGCVAHLLLTGHEVFESASPAEVVAAHMGVQPVAPSLRHGVDACFDALILQCLAKEPGARFASGGVLLRALEHLVVPVESIPLELEAEASYRRWLTVRDQVAPEVASISHLDVARGRHARIYDERAHKPTQTYVPTFAPRDDRGR